MPLLKDGCQYQGDFMADFTHPPCLRSQVMLCGGSSRRAKGDPDPKLWPISCCLRIGSQPSWRPLRGSGSSAGTRAVITRPPQPSDPLGQNAPEEARYNYRTRSMVTKRHQTELGLFLFYLMAASNVCLRPFWSSNSHES